MHATIEKFGYPTTLLREYAHWVVLLRPAQPTFGSLVIAAKSDATAFGALDPAAHAELATVTAEVEAVLGKVVGYQRINYLMLMMVDPHVHMHAIPRYEGERSFDGAAFPDVSWPGPPVLTQAVTLDDDQKTALVAMLKSEWPD